MLYGCIAPQWTRDRDPLLYCVLYSNTARFPIQPALQRRGTGDRAQMDGAMVIMVTWEPGRVRATPHTSLMATGAQESIGERQTGIRHAFGYPR